MNVAIAGYGVEGEESYRYWSAMRDVSVSIVDESVMPSRHFPAGASTVFGPGSFSNLQDYDLVVRTAGLSPHKITTNGKVWSATNEFFEKCPAEIIGVTGSKGKGTTASLIASILEAAGRKVWLVGNIGLPSLSVLANIQPDDIVVYELSSFQLWDLERSPKTAVVLLIEQDHLDVHRDMQAYVNAKANIAKYQQPSDTLIFNANNEYSRLIAGGAVASTVPFPSRASAHVRDGRFYYNDTEICSIHELKLPGAHNLDNAMAAIDAVWGYVQDPDAITRGLAAFKGLPHRLAFAATVNGVDYYDDSIATTPGAAIAAVRAFPSARKVIILGGSHKGSSFTGLAEELTRHDVKVLLIGAGGKVIARALDAAGFSGYELLGEHVTTAGYVKRAAELAQPGDVVLLSPASASFGMYKNYADRGDQFVAAVRRLGGTSGYLVQ